MTIRLEVDGVEYDHFTSASVEIRLDALSNTFSFTAVATGISKPPFKVGAACRVIVGDQTVMTGYIEIADGSYDAGSHSITYRGRDKTGDVVDSNISALSDFGTSISLKTVIEKVITHIGATGVSVIDRANPAKFNPAADLLAPEPGDNAFDFIEKLARKRQVILTSNADGNIVIEKTPGPVIDFALQNYIGASNNNILSASFSYDETGRYNVYKMTSGLNPLSLTGSASTSDIVNQKSSIIDADIRAGRQLAFVPESSFSNSEGDKRARWESRIRRARGQLYSATVQGHKPYGLDELWQVNRVIAVIDDFADIRAGMLINSVVYNFDTSGGSTTNLSLVAENAYNLEIQEPITQKLGASFAG